MQHTSDIEADAVPLQRPIQPVDKVPVEILVETILLSLPPVKQAQSPQRTSLALVCRRWNAVIENNPVLWSKISNQDQPSQVEKSLTKSAGCPIDIYAIWPRLNDYNRSRSELDFLSGIYHHIDRWRHIAIDVVSVGGFNLQDTPAPVLESLEIYWEWDDESPASVPALFKSSWTPRLREVCVEEARLVRWSIPFPPSLSKLIIKGSMYYALPLTGLLDALASCPNLTVFHLESTEFVVDNDNQQRTTFPLVALPALQELTLLELEYEEIGDAFRILRFPEECVVRISCDLREVDSSISLTSLLSHHLEDLQNGSINHMTVCPLLMGCYFGAEGDRWSISLDVDSFDEIRDIMQSFQGDFATRPESSLQNSPHSIPVSVEFNRFFADYDADSLSSISDFRCITCIIMDASPQGQAAMLSYLAGDFMEEDDEEGWPFPCLEELRVKGPTIEMEAVINLVKRRRGNRDESGAPVPLRWIDLEEQEPETKDLNSSGPSNRLFPGTVLELLEILDEGTQLFWQGERVGGVRDG